MLGVDQKTVCNDVRNYSSKSEELFLTPQPFDPPGETYETIIIDPPWPMTKIERELAKQRRSEAGLSYGRGKEIASERFYAINGAREQMRGRRLPSSRRYLSNGLRRTDF
jgi:hypothetical protein